MTRVFYACSGSANLIRTKKFWDQGLGDSNEVSITFSGQILDYCKDSSSPIYMISQNTNKELHYDEEQNITIEHKPKPSISKFGGVRFHIGEFLYGVQLLFKALRFRTDIALIDSGVTHYFILFLFRCFGITVIPILHNTLWPAGFPISKPIPRVIQWFNKLFFQYGASAILGVSAECRKQLLELGGRRVESKIFDFRAQFKMEYFKGINDPPPHEQHPFTIMFIGRVIEYKGVFDILEIAESLNKIHPDKFQWIICGTGPDLDRLKFEAEIKKLTTIVKFKGWVSQEELIDVYNTSHLSIVPTTSGFREGLAMTAVESVLTGRPVITSPVVPALNEMRPACYEAITNDIESYVVGVGKIASHKELYEEMRYACISVVSQFLDRNQGLTAVLSRAIDSAKRR